MIASRAYFQQARHGSLESEGLHSKLRLSLRVLIAADVHGDGLRLKVAPEDECEPFGTGCQGTSSPSTGTGLAEEKTLVSSGGGRP